MRRRRREGIFSSCGMRLIHRLAILLLYFFGQYILINVIKSFNNPSPSCIGITVQPHVHGREQAVTDCAVLLLNLLESEELHSQLYSHGFHLTPGETVQSQSQLPQLRFSIRHDKFSNSGTKELTLWTLHMQRFPQGRSKVQVLRQRLINTSFNQAFKMEGKDTKILRRVRGQPICRESMKRGPALQKQFCYCDKILCWG